MISTDSMLARAWRTGCSLLLLALPVLAAAAPVSERWPAMTSPVFTHITADAGLPDNGVEAMAQDADGFIWMGTQSGLNRYDGYAFQKFRHDADDAGSLPADFIQCLHVDPFGNLWIGTANGGLAKLDRASERFIRYPVGGPQGLSSAYVLAIADDGAGGLWIGTDGGLDHLDTMTGAIVSYHHASSHARSLPDDNVRALYLGRDKTLWLGTNTGLLRLAPGAREFEPVPIIDPGTQRPIGEGASAFVVDGQGKLWFGTLRNGVGSIDGGMGRLIPKQANDKGDLHKQSVQAMLLGVDNRLWIATYGAGLFNLDPATGAWRQMHHDQGDPTSLVDDQCMSLLRDRSDMVWIATEQGVSKIDPTAAAIQTVLADVNTSDHRLAEPNALTMMVDTQDRVWIGYHNQGVDVFDASGRRVKALRSDSRNQSSLPQRSITAFAESKGRNVWIGTRVGLYRSVPEAEKLKIIPIPIGDGHPYVQRLMVDGHMLWVGTDSGLFRYDTEKGTWRAYIASDGKGLSDQRVNALVMRGDHRLWVGTMRGLNLLDPDTGIVTRMSGAATDVLVNGYVVDLTVDRHKRLWVATSGDGIFVLPSEDDGNRHFTQFGTAAGLPNMNIDALQMDVDGRIWASTDNGLAMIDPDSMKVQPFLRADGVQFRNYWNHSSALTADGDVLFGGLGGVSVVHPHLVTSRQFTPPVVVSGVGVGNRSIPALRFNGDLASTVPILVNPEDRAFQVEFSALDYSAPNRNRYAYKLDGYDSDWIRTDASKRVAAYTNMAPGDYRLLIRGSNRDGVMAKQELGVPFRVLSAWYQTWTFRIGLALAAILCVTQLVQVRTAYLRKAQLALEEVVAKRTEELRQSKLRLEEIAFLDALTGLPNRRLFAERFENFRALAERNNARFALLLIDLDKFKGINDTYGHDAGDAVLVATAERLKLATRAVDFVARLGGDEFAVLLDHLDPENTIPSVCERIIQMFVDPIPFGDLKLAISASIGVAMFGIHGSTQPELYKAADLALYEAKNRGRNTWFSSQALSAMK